MTRRGQIRHLSLGSLMRRRTVRFRLTALYCCLFFPSALALVFVTYFLLVLVQVPTGQAVIGQVRAHHGPTTSAPSPHSASTAAGGNGPVHISLIGHSIALGTGEFAVASCLLLLVMIGMSVLLGWFVAGRVLRPLRVMTAATRQISERNLHERLALTGPADELRNLGDTIDELLGRLEAAFDSQRRFVANASHELRTPLMLSQTLLQVALADPTTTLDSLRTACEDAIDAGKDQAQLIEALLTLARSQRGLDQREPVDLEEIASEALNAHEPSAAARGLSVETALEGAVVAGDARLLYRLVSNLIDNAIRYNVANGRIGVTLAAGTTDVTLTVTNTGPSISPDQVSRLLQPFQRAGPDRIASPSGLGLGLSIVADIARAHGAGLEVRRRVGGGLIVIVVFPAIPTDPRALANRDAAARLPVEPATEPDPTLS